MKMILRQQIEYESKPGENTLSVDILMPMYMSIPSLKLALRVSIEE